TVQVVQLTASDHDQFPARRAQPLERGKRIVVHASVRSEGAVVIARESEVAHHLAPANRISFPRLRGRRTIPAIEQATCRLTSNDRRRPECDGLHFRSSASDTSRPPRSLLRSAADMNSRISIVCATSKGGRPVWKNSAIARSRSSYESCPDDWA